MSEKDNAIASFDPNGPALTNSVFGLPFNYTTAEIILMPVPWEVTVSYGTGTAEGPEAIKKASQQVDLFQKDIKDAWKLGIHYHENNSEWFREKSAVLREKSEHYLEKLESADKNTEINRELDAINQGCKEMVDRVEETALTYLNDGKIVGLIGGDHSTPLGLIKALSGKHEDLGLLQIDAHMDLRKAYEGFNYSHASIAYNFMQNDAIGKLVQVGIRDFCEEEFDYVQQHQDKISIFYDDEIQANLYDGQSWQVICDRIIKELPDHIYISFDIDGLDPSLCPNTGTPVPGGLSYQQVNYLIARIVKAGKVIVGFDLNEVGVHPDYDWDANVGARILYRLCNLTAVSQGKLSWSE